MALEADGLDGGGVHFVGEAKGENAMCDGAACKLKGKREKKGIVTKSDGKEEKVMEKKRKGQKSIEKRVEKETKKEP